ncbi:MAG: cytidylate kinase-like family protein [Deltaproteobacteria bacterium]|nr:cytidylate kinase-like family protein [Deltaproteobacteria bacterium]
MAVVTISRQFGAGGWAMAERLCSRLGFHLVDEQVIDELARKAKISPDWLSAVEKEASSVILRAISSVVTSRLLYRPPGLPGEGFERKRYISFLRRVMTAVADEGGYVLVGRGAQFVLKGHPNAIHVMLVGEYENRVRFLMEKYNFSREEAERTIKEKERQRSGVACNVFETDINDLGLYHVVFNTSLVSIDWAVDAVVSLVNTRFQGD